MGHGKRADMIVHEAEPYNAEAPRGALVGQQLTALDSFYCRNHSVIPAIDADSWELRVDGLVERTLDLSLAQLKERFVEHTVIATLQCAGNRRREFLGIRDIPDEAPWGSTATGTALWTGVRLHDVLAAAGLNTGARHVEFLGPDVAPDLLAPQPYGSSISVEKATSAEVLLAWAMNGEPLSAEHGAPLRVVVPGYIGARSVKWVQCIRGLRRESDNYFQSVAYRLHGAALGALVLNCDILSPDYGAHLMAGQTNVTGYALGGAGRDVASVEVSVDSGQTWTAATLAARLGPWAWRHWWATVDLPAGDGQILARAWDSAGDPQPESAEQLWNPKGYVNNSWGRVPVRGYTV